MNKDNKEASEKPVRFIASEILPSGEIIEMVYQDYQGTTGFWLNDGKEIKFVEKVDRPNETLLPFPAQNHLIRKKVVLLPSDTMEYGDTKQLIARTQAFIHKYVSVTERFEKIASYYVLFSWVYDAFSELAYLRAQGDFGSGKSRLLKTIGSVCYKPMFTGGAATTSPIFRIINSFQGTLIVDEADLRFSETTVDMVKILNSGFQKGTAVLRSEGKGEFEVKTFDVFGPKIVGMRGTYADLALESRFLTEEMGRAELRKDIPINLPAEFESEALTLRNQLLLWRLENRAKIKLKPVDDELTGLEPRLKQIATPLLSIIDDTEVRKEICSVMKEYANELTIDRGLSLESEVFEALLALYGRGNLQPTVKDVADEFRADRDFKERLSTGRMGNLLRKHLRLHARRASVGWTIPQLENEARIATLKIKYGIPEKE